MTELYDIGYAHYLEMTAPANEDRLPQLIQQIYAECDCIAFEDLKRTDRCLSPMMAKGHSA